MKRWLRNSGRLLWILAKLGVVAWFVTRHLEAPAFVYKNF